VVTLDFLAGGALDGGFHFVLPHVERAGILDASPQVWVRFRALPPDFTAIAISLEIRANCFAILFYRANMTCLRGSNMPPMAVLFLALFYNPTRSDVTHVFRCNFELA
jgi:hypothetical protein